MTETISWHNASTPPDEDSTVLMCSEVESEPVWPGYFSEGEWRTAEGMPCRGVTHWAELPKGPTAEERK